MNILHSSLRFNQGEEVEELFNLEGTNADVIEPLIYQNGISENVFETSIILVSDPSMVIGGLPLELDLTINIAGIYQITFNDPLVAFSTISEGIGTIFQAPGKTNMLLGNLYSIDCANYIILFKQYLLTQIHVIATHARMKQVAYV